MSIDPMTAASAVQGVRSAVDLFRSALALFREAKDALPDNSHSNAIEKSIEEAERQIRLAEVQVAQSLGYQLCQCTFPPQIMLSIGRHPRGRERFQCPTCKKLEPSDQHFLEAVDRYNATLPRSLDEVR
jgi:hypothetical protein